MDEETGAAKWRRRKASGGKEDGDEHEVVRSQPLQQASQPLSARMSQSLSSALQRVLAKYLSLAFPHLFPYFPAVIAPGQGASLADSFVTSTCTHAPVQNVTQRRNHRGLQTTRWVEGLVRLCAICRCDSLQRQRVRIGQ
jgi:hypothetical protein